MSVKANANKFHPDTWLASLLGALYFLLTGFILIHSDIPMEWSIPARLHTIDTLFFLGLVVPAIGFAAGWALGFPRWSYPYTGGLLVFSLYLMNGSTPLLYRLTGDMQRWGWRAWIPALLAAATGAAISWISRTRSSPPLPSLGEGQAMPYIAGARADSPRPSTGTGPTLSADSPLPPAGEGTGVRASGVSAFFSNISHDPTLASYAMFAWMPLIISIAFDEIARRYSLVFMLLLTALMVATAVLYHRPSRGDTRANILIVGLLLTLVVTELGMIAYWLPRDGVYLPGALMWGVVIAVIILYPVWVMRLMKPAHKADAS
jgi:hypothetical protein